MNTIRVKNNIFKIEGYKIDNIYNMGCSNLIEKIKDNTIDLIFADPPYNLSNSKYNIKFVKSGGADLTTNYSLSLKYLLYNCNYNT
jgi:DNA modification methylase